MFYVGQSTGAPGLQIDAVAPSGTPTGEGTVVVTQEGQSSPVFPITVVASSPGA